MDRIDEPWLYCTVCGRAMRQEDCGADIEDCEATGVGGPSRCIYDDCPSQRNLAFQSLYGWDAYRLAHSEETVDWPESPTLGECYRLEGSGP